MRLSIILLLFIPFLSYAQQDTTFSKVDSIARTIRYDKDIYKLTRELTNPYDDQILKVRSIFIWITDNIRYDYKFVNKGKEVYEPACKTGDNCELVRKNWEYTYLRKILKKKKAICSGYSMLFKRMCDIAGVKCEVISGYAKTKFYEIGNKGGSHAWNAVVIDSVYYLLDATWAAGGCDEDENTGKLLKFKKQYDNYYWFTSFHDLVRNHYPKDKRWEFDPNYTKEKYLDNPYYNGNVLAHINIFSPTTGVIKAKKGDTIHFEFDYSKKITYLQVNTNVFRNLTVMKYYPKLKLWDEDTFALRRQKYIPFKRNGDRYKFDYIVTDNSLYYLDILFDYERALRFKVKIDQDEI